MKTKSSVLLVFILRVSRRVGVLMYGRDARGRIGQSLWKRLPKHPVTYNGRGMLFSGAEWSFQAIRSA